MLILEGDWFKAIWMNWMGREPTPRERIFITACFIASIDHGSETPSAQAAIRSAQTGASLSGSVAAGMEAIDARHGAAATPACEWLKRARLASSLEEFIHESMSDGRRIPGFGHRVYEVDPRVQALHTLIKQQAIDGSYLSFAEEVAVMISQEKGQPIPVNIDGAIGAIVADLDLPSALANAIFLFSRTAGLVTQVRKILG